MKVVIVDDDRLVCASLEVILGAQEDIEVVGLGADGEEAVRLYFDLRPDVLLLDIQMSVRDGLSAAREVIERDPAARVVFLTTFSDDDYLVRALRYGARGYLIKQDVATIAPALRAVMNGQSVLEGEVLARVPLPQAHEDARERTLSEGQANEGLFAQSVAEARPDAFALLTDREFEVVRLVAQGFDNKEIAERAYLSEGTVRNHVSAILSKLNLKNRTQIAVTYYRGHVG